MKFICWLRDLFGRNKEAQERTLYSETDAGETLNVDLFNPFPEPVTIEIADVIDLHTIPPRDVKRVVEEYIAQARERGFRSVRIIHGKGTGAQREIVRSILSRTVFVENWTDAPPEAGGFGATIVRIRSGKIKFHPNSVT